MFQRRTDEMLKVLLNAFGIADDIVTVGHNKGSTDHDDGL